MLHEWLQPSHGLLMPFFLVVFLLAVALVFPGVRLLEQDRARGRQREGEILDRAADSGLRALEQDLAALANRLSGPAWTAAEVPEGCLYILLNADRIEATPPVAYGREAWRPNPVSS